MAGLVFHVNKMLHEGLAGMWERKQRKKLNEKSFILIINQPNAAFNS